MAYTKIAPLGNRIGPGTYDCFWKPAYRSMEEALAANDFIVVDFVTDENGIIYFEFYHINTPQIKKYHRLMFQHFPFGVDTRDDWMAGEIAQSMF